MISLERVSKSFQTDRGMLNVIDDVSCIFARGLSIAILGPDVEAKALLLRLLSGRARPSAGRVRRKGRIFTGVTKLPLSLTGVENAKFACRIYGMDLQSVMDYIARLTELGSVLDQPLMTYSTEMKNRFTVALNLALRFDTYLIDAQNSPPDARFLRNSASVFEPGPNKRDVILVSGSQKAIRRFCSHGVILRDGKLSELAPIEEALAESHRFK